MQTYGPLFAKIYNDRWSGFARHAAPALLDYYAGTPAGQARLPVLDLCCGTGQIALAFLEQGYTVSGLDLSPHMLALAAQNAAGYLETGQARFIQGDAANFSLPPEFGLALSTYDALNHLDSLEALRGCFRSVAAALAPGGSFIFDLNTRKGLEQRWNSLSVQDEKDLMIVQRGMFDGQGDRAYTMITGFARAEDGRYERFEEAVFNTVFSVEAVLEALRRAGWPAAYPARLQSLGAPLAEPEAEGRVFFVACQPAE